MFLFVSFHTYPDITPSLLLRIALQCRKRIVSTVVLKVLIYINFKVLLRYIEFFYDVHCDIIENIQRIFMYFIFIRANDTYP